MDDGRLFQFWNRCHRCHSPYDEATHWQWGGFFYCQDCFLQEITGDLVEAYARRPAWGDAIKRSLAWLTSRIEEMVAS